MCGVEHDDDKATALVGLDRKIESTCFAEIDVGGGRYPGRKLFVLFCILNCATQGQKLDVFVLNVASGVVFALPWVEFRDNAVQDVSIIIDDEDIPDAHVLIVQQRVAQVADNLVKVLIALEALESEGNAGHDGLLLLDDHAGVGVNRAQVEVVLNTERESEHQGQQQQEPGTEASYLGGESHAKTKIRIRASDVCISGNCDALNVYLYCEPHQPY